MTEAEVLDIVREGLFQMLIVSAPVLLTGLVIGLIVSLFQALTQIQEMTLTFVPKILFVFASLVLFLPFMLHSLMDFTRMVFDRAANGG